MKRGVVVTTIRRADPRDVAVLPGTVCDVLADVDADGTRKRVSV